MRQQNLRGMLLSLLENGRLMQSEYYALRTNERTGMEQLSVMGAIASKAGVAGGSNLGPPGVDARGMKWNAFERDMIPAYYISRQVVDLFNYLFAELQRDDFHACVSMFADVVPRLLNPEAIYSSRYVNMRWMRYLIDRMAEKTECKTLRKQLRYSHGLINDFGASDAWVEELARNAKGYEKLYKRYLYGWAPGSWYGLRKPKYCRNAEAFRADAAKNAMHALALMGPRTEPPFDKALVQGVTPRQIVMQYLESIRRAELEKYEKQLPKAEFSAALDYADRVRRIAVSNVFSAFVSIADEEILKTQGIRSQGRFRDRL